MNRDKLFLDNYIMDLKSTVEVYVHGTLESANPDVRKILKDGLDETLKHQAKTYDKMTEYGWYNVSNVKTDKIQKKYDSLECVNC